ncbi:serine hydrolase domain-containing protein [Granulosicoccus antarcticus]|uniref:Penicillin-binding protein 4 n=1 Tax=Granulosicoccus antarcticus IMCC3135 TaxID=1192854 RepID=A0A2Z2NT84_9GAMM|nr:serine hydrolase domain-containing protein [Granulosicoccus antarcticus]ASJ70324.1 Penicillin-binding protein 4* [Granulosicoccus antarcticus IMCC3135]
MTIEKPDILPFDARFAQYDEACGPGLAVLVIQDGTTVFKRGYGLSNLETKERIDCDTNFRMASVSKQFTAMAVAILEEQGKISGDHYIGNYLVDLPEYMSKIKVCHLVHHLSGLPDYGDAFFSSNKNKPLISNDDVYAYYKSQTKLDFEIGERYEYSNGGYSLLALIVESASGQSFKDFSKDRIFDPAGMKNTAIITYPSTIRNQAISYGAWPFFENIDYNTGNALQGEDGVYTSLTDMEAWIHAIDNNILVSPATTERIFSKVKTNNGEDVQYGYGWGFDQIGGMEVRVHTGGWVGFNTVIVNAHEVNTWFVAFSNTEAISSEDASIEMAKYYLDLDINN